MTSSGSLSYSSREPVQRYFEIHAEFTPDRIAVVSHGGAVTYGELNERANRVARYLDSLSLESGAHLGICVERGIDAVAGMLGILKSGRVCVPLDPRYPSRRLSFILQNARLRCVLTQLELVDKVDALTLQGTELLCFEPETLQATPLAKGTAPAEQVADIAFILYTSGSTGNPKGVLIPHSSMSYYVQALRQVLQVGEGDRYLHTASLAFSSSNRQLLLPLSVGGTVVIATAEQVRDPLALFDLIKSQRVTVIDLVPSHWRSCINALSRLDQTSRSSLLENDLRLLLSASESLLSDVPRQWREKLGRKARFVNMYGTTETSGIVATYEIPAENVDRTEVVAIGRPVPGAEIYILDERQHPVPDGEVGTLYVGGPGVTRGYLAEAGHKDNLFTVDLSSSRSGARLYRTGDLALRRADGVIEYRGRADDQLNIRGSRVEPREIELTLNRHPAVEQSVVVGRNYGDVPNLVAYYVTRPNQFPGAIALRRFLLRFLPEPVVPSYFCRIDALPISPNGKIDRAGLPDPRANGFDVGNVTAEPRTCLEKKMLAIWADSLGQPRLGIYSNFFEFGGDSLKAIDILSKVHAAFNVRLPGSLLIERPTVAELVDYIEATTPGLCSPRIRETGRI